MIDSALFKVNFYWLILLFNYLLMCKISLLLEHKGYTTPRELTILDIGFVIGLVAGILLHLISYIFYFYNSNLPSFMGYSNLPFGGLLVFNEFFFGQNTSLEAIFIIGPIINLGILGGIVGYFFQAVYNKLLPNLGIYQSFISLTISEVAI